MPQKAGHIVKRITVDPGRALSLHRHRHRSEHWLVKDGVASIRRDGETCTLKAGQSIDIPVDATHSLANEGNEPLVVIEVQMGERLEEDDIMRLSDRYGRA